VVRNLFFYHYYYFAGVARSSNGMMYVGASQPQQSQVQYSSTVESIFIYNGLHISFIIAFVCLLSKCQMLVRPIIELLLNTTDRTF
jgi:hypothetical protein